MGRFLVLASLLLWSLTAQARVELVNRDGARIDLQNIQVRDEDGTVAPLGKFFTRPVVLALVYFGCPGTCTALLNNLVNELNRIQPTAGADFDVLAVSIDPSDSATVAQAKKANYLRLYRRNKTQPEAAHGWHFLTGKTADITKLTEAVGFYFAKDEASGLINHPSALFFLTKEGVLSETLPGLSFSKRDLIRALYANSHGLVNSTYLRLSAVLCGDYALLPTRWMLAAAFTLLSGIAAVRFSRPKSTT